MSIGDRNSIIARTRYRLNTLLRKIKYRLNPVFVPATFAEVPLPGPVASIGDPRLFTKTPYGNGAFGQWILDEAGLPAYQYDMHQYDNDDAVYPVSQGAFRRDHWHQVGNDRITGIASNDGSVEVYIADGGGMFLNRADEGSLISVFGALWEIIKIIVHIPGRILRALTLKKRHEASIIVELFAVAPVPQTLLKLLQFLGAASGSAHR